MRHEILLIGFFVFLLWYDRCLFTDILATIISALVAVIMAVLSIICVLAILVMLPVNFCGRLLGHNTSLWTGSVVAAIMLAMKPIQRKAQSHEDSKTTR